MGPSPSRQYFRPVGRTTCFWGSAKPFCWTREVCWFLRVLCFVGGKPGRGRGLGTDRTSSSRWMRLQWTECTNFLDSVSIVMVSCLVTLRGNTVNTVACSREGTFLAW